MYSLAHSGDPEIAPSHPGTTTLFLFDYECVEEPEEDSVFSSIQTCLGRSQGVCALNDSGHLGADALTKFVNRALDIKAVAGGVVDTGRYRSMTPSVATMWTDRPENVELFHDYLNRHTVPRYQGAVLLDANVSYKDFLGFCARYSGMAVRSSGVQKVLGAGLDVYDGLKEWFQSCYIRVRASCVESQFKRVGAPIGALLVLALVVFLVVGQSADVPLVGQSVTHEPNPAERLPKALAPAKERTARVVPTPSVTGVAEAPPTVDPQPDATSPALSPQKLAGPRVAAAGIQPAPFTVQVGSFRSSRSATGLVQQLKAKGYQAIASTTVLPNGRTMHRVRVGSFRTRKEAAVFGENLKRRERLVTGFFVAASE